MKSGSGPGGNLDFIYNRGTKKITGVDISQQMVARSEFLLAGKDIDVLKINGKDLPFGYKNFDIVFTSTVLQHNTNENELAAVDKRNLQSFQR